MEKSPSIQPSDISAIFNNWDTILSLSERLLEQLESQWGKWPCVKFGMGQIFIKMVGSTKKIIWVLLWFVLTGCLCRHHSSVITSSLCLDTPNH